MAREHEVSEKPLVVLEADKLLGMRQVAQVSTGRADDGLRRAETSKMLSKIGEPPGPDSRAGLSRLLSKIGEVPESRAAAVSRAELSRLLSKIGEVTAPKSRAAAVSRAELSRLLSKIGEAG